MGFKPLIRFVKPKSIIWNWRKELSWSFEDHHLEVSKCYKYTIERPRTYIWSYYMKWLKKSKMGSARCSNNQREEPQCYKRLKLKDKGLWWRCSFNVVLFKKTMSFQSTRSKIAFGLVSVKVGAYENSMLSKGTTIILERVNTLKAF